MTMRKVCLYFPTIPQMMPWLKDILIPSLKYLPELYESGAHVDVWIKFQGVTLLEVEAILPPNSKWNPEQRYFRVPVNDTWCNKIYPIIEDYTPLDTADHLGMYYSNRLKCVPSDYDFYIMADDDFRYQEGSFSHYLECIEYLTENPDCAVVMSGTPLGSGDKDKPVPFRGLYSMTRGLVFRNLERILPEHFINGCVWIEPFNWDGAYMDDHILITAAFNYGFYGAKHYRGPTQHYDLVPGITPEQFEAGRKVPKDYKDYFRWKLDRTSIYNEENWKKCGDFKYFQTIYGLKDDFVVNRDNMYDWLRLNWEWLNTTYKPLAMERFGRARFLEDGCVGG